MDGISDAAISCADVVGASWTALLLASVQSVSVYDSEPNIESGMRGHV